MTRDRDAGLARRAALVVAAQTAAAVTVVVAVVAVLVLVLTDRAQHRAADRIVRTAASTARSVATPPFGIVLLIRDADGRVEVSPGAPGAISTVDVAALPPGPGTLAVPTDADDPAETTPFDVYTLDRDGQRVVAALDTTYLARDREGLVAALLTAGLVGVAVATGVGWLIGTRAVRPLGRALDLQRRFVTDASHELRTPLSILHTRAQVVARRPGVDQATAADLDRLVVDARVLGEIVNDLLLSAELQHHPDMNELLDLDALAREVVASFAPAADAAGITLLAHVPDAPVVVAGVPVALRRAVNALVDNALGHTPAAGRITVTVGTAGDAASVTVTDTGEGIDPADARRLLDRFARAPHAPGTGRRFGLGLALVREVVQAHGGTVELTGAPGGGATATITLPLSRHASPGSGANSHDVDE